MINHSEHLVAPPTAALEIDLWPYVAALLESWRLVLMAGVLAGALAYVAGQMASPLYESSARISVVDIEDPGGVSPDDRRAPEVLTLVEHGFIMGTTRDNYDQVMLARLRSRQFAQLFLDTFNIYKHMFPEHWDNVQDDWKNGFELDRGLAFTIFRDSVRLIEHDEETDIITVKMQWPDALLAKEWVNNYIVLFNDYMRKKTLGDVEKKQSFLIEELKKSELVDIERSIYRLIEAQTAIAMLAHAREEYVLEVIDPGALPYASVSMSPRKRALLGFMTGLLLSVFFLFCKILLIRLLARFRQHQETYQVDIYEK